MAKIELVKFSGQQRDFANLYKEFCSIIVQNRARTEVRIYLRQVVPNQYRHLLDKIEVDHLVDMLVIIKDKFGTATLLQTSKRSNVSQLIKVLSKLEKKCRGLSVIWKQ